MHQHRPERLNLPQNAGSLNRAQAMATACAACPYLVRVLDMCLWVKANAQNGVAEFTTRFRTYLSGWIDVHWGLTGLMRCRLFLFRGKRHGWPEASRKIGSTTERARPSPASQHATTTRLPSGGLRCPRSWGVGMSLSF